MATPKKASGKKAEAAQAQTTVTSLQDIVNAGPNGMMVAMQIANELAAAGLVEVNSAMVNAVGEIATRATQAGIDSLQAGTQAEPEIKKEPEMTSQSAPVAAAGFAIRSVAMPSSSSGKGGRNSKYPFAALEKGQSFFVPGGESKSLASTVTGANLKFSQVDPSGATRTNKKGVAVPARIQDREFCVRSIADGAEWGHTGVKGCAVFRTL